MYTNVKDPQFGAVGNGVADDTMAINSALMYLNSQGGGTLFIPVGTYKITSVLTMYPNITILGESQSVTVFAPSTDGMTVFSLVFPSITSANVYFKNFTIYCGATPNVRGMEITLAEKTEICNVEFAGCLNNFTIDRGRIHTIQNVISQGTPSLKAGTCFIISSVDNDYVYFVKLSNYQILNIGNGVYGSPAAVYIRRAVGSDFNQITANDLRTGVTDAVPGILVENDCQGNRFTNCMIIAPLYGIVFQQGYGVAVRPTFQVVSNCDVDQPTACGILINGASWITCIGGNVTAGNLPKNISGILVQTNSTYVTITDYVVMGFTDLAGGAGITLLNVEYVKLLGNRVLDNGVGVNFMSNCSKMMVVNNDIIPAQGGVAIAGSPLGSGNIVKDNMN
jgi:pectate lyase-like protein/parallel beta helix pectate lyase-like protein